MSNYYLLILMLFPLLSSFFIFLIGEGHDKENFKSVLSKLVYFTQFNLSIAAFFILKDYSTTYHFIEMQSYHYELSFSLNKLHIYFAGIFSLLFILTEKLSFNYLHGEEEHSKFYSLKMILNFATMAFIFSDNIDFLFFNWEIVGISSALLISYFYRRNQAVEHSLFAYSVYRICDAAFLMAGLVLHYFFHSEMITTVAHGTEALILGLLIFMAIMGKSGIYPFSSWLPLALEGPTPSSNLYYMTLSTHLGAIFLLKSSALWESNMTVKMIMISVCALSILITSLSARVQTTIKGALAYSTLSQVSLIIIEIVLGFHIFAAIHLGLHMFYRLSQMALAPSIIDKYNLMEHITPLDKLERQSLSRSKLYFLALSGFKSEEIIKIIFKFFMLPFLFIYKIELLILNFDKASEHEHNHATIGGGSK